MTALAELMSQLDAQSQQAVVEALKSAQQARSNCELGEAEDGPEELHKRLLVCRANLDRLEHIAAQLGRLKSRSQQAVADRRDAYDDAYAQAATSSSAGFSDYSSAKERDAQYALKAVGEKMELRKAERRHRDIDSAWEYVRLLHRGAEGTRRDLETRIRLITLAGALDR